MQLSPTGTAIKQICTWVVYVAIGLVSTVAQAEVAHVVEIRGTAMVARSGVAPHILGAGDRLDERDTVSIAHDSWAILEFTDQTRLTLRPGTVFRLDNYREQSPESMMLGLVKGGFRAITGLIGKRNPSSVKFVAANATIGIRGTEFDARLCEEDCAVEEQAVSDRAAESGAIGYVVDLNGYAAAAHRGGAARMLVPGSAIYEYDGIATGPTSELSIVFRDDTRISLAPESSFSIVQYRVRGRPALVGNVHLKFLEGDAQLWTGRLAVSNPDDYLIETHLGILRPRIAPANGASIESREEIPPGSALQIGNLFAWGQPVLVADNSGVTRLAGLLGGQQQFPKAVRTDQARASIAIRQGFVEVAGHGILGTGQALQADSGKRAAKIAGSGITSNAPRADRLNVDPGMFGKVAKAAPGLYVWVREGAVTLARDGQVAIVGAGESMRVDEAGMSPLEAVPNFMRFDTTPFPAASGLSATHTAFMTRDGSLYEGCSVAVTHSGEPSARGGNGTKEGESLPVDATSPGQAGGVRPVTSIGGEATGGGSSRPKGPTQKKPGDLGDKDQEGSSDGPVSRDDFSSGRELQGLLDGRQSDLNDEAAGKNAKAPGRASGSDFLQSMNNDGLYTSRRNISRREQQSDGGNEGGGGATHDTAGPDNTRSTVPEQERSWTMGRVWAIIQRAVGGDDVTTRNDCGSRSCMGHGPRGKPSPDSAEGAHMPRTFNLAMQAAPTPEEIQKSRRRQVSMPSDSRGRNADLDTLRHRPMDRTMGRNPNLTDPVEGDGTETVNGNGSAHPNGPEGLANPAGKKDGTGPKPDDPTQ
jgi:hypothetical protein